VKSGDLPVPIIRVLPLDGVEVPRPLLTEPQRQKLAAIASKLELPARSIVYRDGESVDCVYVVGGGIVVAYRDMPSGKRRVAGFRFQGDLFGLAEDGKYVNSTRALTAVTLFRLPLDALTRLLQEDPGLQFQFLLKTVHELRQAQRKAIIVARRDAAGRVAMFVDMLHRLAEPEARGDVVEIPMTRSDIADFLHLELESVSRACRRLTDTGVLSFEGRGARVLDRAAFNALVGGG
jgi:CRP-like cAMP-binding protein